MEREAIEFAGAAKNALQVRTKNVHAHRSSVQAREQEIVWDDRPETQPFLESFLGAVMKRSDSLGTRLCRQSYEEFLLLDVHIFKSQVADLTDPQPCFLANCDGKDKARISRPLNKGTDQADVVVRIGAWQALDLLLTMEPRQDWIRIPSPAGEDEPVKERTDIVSTVRPEQRRYFFERLENPEWIEPLRERGFFNGPPSPVSKEPNVIEFRLC
jgi:hypothetical protein